MSPATRRLTGAPVEKRTAPHQSPSTAPAAGDGGVVERT